VIPAADPVPGTPASARPNVVAHPSRQSGVAHARKHCFQPTHEGSTEQVTPEEHRLLLVSKHDSQPVAKEGGAIVAMPPHGIAHSVAQCLEVQVLSSGNATAFPVGWSY
jgi:hypothetical protein